MAELKSRKLVSSETIPSPQGLQITDERYPSSGANLASFLDSFSLFSPLPLKSIGVKKGYTGSKVKTV